MDAAESPEKPMPATSPLRGVSPDPAEDASSLDREAASSKPFLTCGWSDEQLALIRQAISQQTSHTDSKEMTDESKAFILDLLKDRLRVMIGFSNPEEGTEDAVSVTKSQPGSDFEKKEQKHQGQAGGPEIQQPPWDGGCPECPVKTARIGELEMRLMDQEEEAKQHERAAIVHQRELAYAHIVEVREELSRRIDKLEAQQSGQTSTSEDPASRPLPPHYYCDDCWWTQKKLDDAKQKSRDLENEVEHHQQRVLMMEHIVKQTRGECEVLRQRLDETDIKIARLCAQPGPRTSKL